MRADAHLVLVRERVRTGDLARFEAVRLEGGTLFAIAGGLGPPRLWKRGVQSTLSGVTEAAAATQGQTSSVRLQRMANQARVALVQENETLLSGEPPSDASLFLLLLEGDEANVLGVGPGRAYVQHKGMPQRLTPRDHVVGGLTQGTPFFSSIALQPKDLILVGSEGVFSTGAVARLVTLLKSEPDAPLSIMGNILAHPATQAGVGAALLVLRIR